MSDAILNLGDIPDLSGISDFLAASDPWVDGWYRGQIVAKREFTDKNGNDRVFESGDAVSAKGDSRNITLQTMVTRKDGKTSNQSIRLNYRPEDLSQETVQAIAQQIEVNKANVGEKPQWGTLFRSYMALTQLGALQKIAGVRQFQRTGDGGLDLTPLFEKTVYVRLAPDDRNPQYKAVDRFQANEPKKVPVL